MKIVIIGCGLIGKKRALALSEQDEIAACCDSNPQTAQNFGNQFNCKVYFDYRELLNEILCDAVIVAVVNKYAKNIIIQCIKKGIHILAEKPLGRNAGESEQIVDALKEFSTSNLSSGLKGVSEPILKTGFNHRFHPAVWQAKKIIDSNEIGKVLLIRARYGHGGRPGMEEEWRSSLDLCGGGELLDQGVHIIDLIRWFGGEVNEVFGLVETKFWNIEVEDNAFVILKTQDNVIANFHVSWTNWKNIFSFEAFGQYGYLKIEGLGGSYGKESLEIGIRNKGGGKPNIESVEFPLEDISWSQEWKEFKSAVRNKRRVLGDGLDGHNANKIIEAIYKSSKEKRIVYI